MDLVYMCLVARVLTHQPCEVLINRKCDVDTYAIVGGIYKSPSSIKDTILNLIVGL